MSPRKIPRRVHVAEVVLGRYPPGEKPPAWSDRAGGIDRIRTSEGEVLTLYSGGAQSTPAPGWEILLTRERAQLDSSEPALQWTLYGILPRDSSTASSAKVEAL